MSERDLLAEIDSINRKLDEIHKTLIASAEFATSVREWSTEVDSQIYALIEILT